MQNLYHNILRVFFRGVFIPLGRAVWVSSSTALIVFPFMVTQMVSVGEQTGALSAMLGKIAEQRGWPGKAIEHYEKFLDVWRDADPDIPEIDEARKRLADLAGQ